MFTAGDDSSWTELTRGTGPVVRVSAVDLQAAKRERNRLRSGGDVSVVLDITVQIAENFRAARRGMPAHGGAGTHAIEYAAARSASLTMSRRASEVSSSSGRSASAARQACALLTIAASGWFSSCAIEPVTSPTVATRATCVSAACVSRSAFSASFCGVRSRTKATPSSGDARPALPIRTGTLGAIRPWRLCSMNLENARSSARPRRGGTPG